MLISTLTFSIIKNKSATVKESAAKSNISWKMLFIL